MYCLYINALSGILLPGKGVLIQSTVHIVGIQVHYSVQCLRKTLNY